MKVVLLGGIRGLWAEGVAWMLRSEGYELVAAYEGVAELMVALESLCAELVLIDFDYRPIDWVGIGRVHDRRRDLKLILMTSALTPEAAAAIRADQLAGVIEKRESPEQAGATLLHVRQGRRVYPTGWQQVGRPCEAGAERLSDREVAILRLVAAGLRNREIASNLMISQNTVKFHLRGLYARLGVRNRIEAVQMFSRMRGGDS